MSAITFREALVTAVDLLRESGYSAEAKILEAKAEKLRARSETPAAWLIRCYCGARKIEGQLVCPDCHSILPAELLFAWHFSTGHQHTKAMRQIRAICLSRTTESEAAA